MHQKRVLLISAVTPARTGSGVAMRAWRTLQSLSNNFETHFVLIDKVGGSPDKSAALESVREKMASFHLFPLRSYEGHVRSLFRGNQKKGWAKIVAQILGRPFRAAAFPEPLVESVAQTIKETDFDVVFFLRLYAGVLIAEPSIQRAVGDRPILFDQDDIDSDYLQRELIQLRAKMGRVMSFLQWLDVRKVRRVEHVIWRRCHSVFVCSEVDAAKIGVRASGVNCKVMPNVVQVAPSVVDMPRSNGTSKVILFIGTLSYGPNADGVLYFCNEVFDRVAKLLEMPVVLKIVGSGAPEEVKRLACRSNIEVAGFVEDVADAYRGVDLAIVPIRYGAGTRIKILEAFTFGVPVVSTPIGAEGLEVKNEAHLMLADSADEFVSACVHLLNDRRLSDTLAANGRRLVEERYSEAAVDNVVISAVHAASSDNGR